MLMLKRLKKKFPDLTATINASRVWAVSMLR